MAKERPPRPPGLCPTHGFAGFRVSEISAIFGRGAGGFEAFEDRLVQEFKTLSLGFHHH